MSAAVRLASRIANTARRVVMEPRASRETRADTPFHRWCRGTRRSVTASLLALVTAVSLAQAAEGEPGELGSRFGPEGGEGGYRVGQTGLWVGGFASLEVEVPES